MNHITALDSVAKRKAGNNEGWEPFLYERVGDDFVIKGGIPRILIRGANKGGKRWDGSPIFIKFIKA